MFSFRTLRTNIAQILLIYLLFPIFVFLCHFFKPNILGETLFAFLSQVDLISTIADLLGSHNANVTTNDVANLTLWTFFKEFPATIIAGISIDFFTNMFNFMWKPLQAEDKNFRPLPILPAFIGFFVSTIITGLINLSGNDLIAFFIEWGVVLLMLWGIKVVITLKWGPGFLSIKRFLLWIIEGLYGIILSIYSAGLILIKENSNPFSAVPFILTVATCTLLASALVYVVRLGIKKDLK